MARDETVEIFATFFMETDRAVLINDGSQEEDIWVPKSQITEMEDDMERGEDYSFTMTEWIAREKGFI